VTNDAGCDGFLKWAMPRRGLRWPGFRRNKRQVVRRIHGRIAELGLAGVAGYRQFLDEHPEEWTVFDALCRVTISRFGRDREMWATLVDDVLPRLAREAMESGRRTVNAWSAGCGAGEEPFTLVIAWTVEIVPRWPVELAVLATDIDEVQLGRAAAGCFPAGALRELPDHWRRAAFDARDEERLLREPFRAPVRFAHHDVRSSPPDGAFDLVLCRNLAFSYFDEPVQAAVATSLRAVLRTGGVLVVGNDERVPDGVRGLVPTSHGIYLATE